MLYVAMQKMPTTDEVSIKGVLTLTPHRSEADGLAAATMGISFRVKRTQGSGEDMRILVDLRRPSADFLPARAVLAHGAAPPAWLTFWRGETTLEEFIAASEESWFPQLKDTPEEVEFHGHTMLAARVEAGVIELGDNPREVVDLACQGDMKLIAATVLSALSAPNCALEGIIIAPNKPAALAVNAEISYTNDYIPKHVFEVVVGNVGTVLRTTDSAAAKNEYRTYVQSLRDGSAGRADSVTLIRDDDAIEEFREPLFKTHGQQALGEYLKNAELDLPAQVRIAEVLRAELGGPVVRGFFDEEHLDALLDELAVEEVL